MPTENKAVTSGMTIMLRGTVLALEESTSGHSVEMLECAARLFDEMGKHTGTPDRKRPTASKARSGSFAVGRNR